MVLGIVPRRVIRLTTQSEKSFLLVKAREAGTTFANLHGLVFFDTSRWPTEVVHWNAHEPLILATMVAMAMTHGEQVLPGKHMGLIFAYRDTMLGFVILFPRPRKRFGAGKGKGRGKSSPPDASDQGIRLRP